MNRQNGIAFLAAAFATVFTLNCSSEFTPSGQNPDAGGQDDTGADVGVPDADTTTETGGDTAPDVLPDTGQETTDNDTGAHPDVDAEETTEEVVDDTVFIDHCADCAWITEVEQWECAGGDWWAEFSVENQAGVCWLTVEDVTLGDTYNVEPNKYQHDQDSLTVRLSIDPTDPDWWVTCTPRSGI